MSPARIVYRTLCALIPIALLAGCGDQSGDEQTAAETIVVEETEIALGEAEDTASTPAGAEEPAAGQAAEFALVWEPAELQARLDDEGLRVLDARAAEAYDEAHIPGAVPVDVANWKSQASGEGGLHDAAAWSERLGELGIDNSTQVVVYGDSLPNTARIWWTLKYVGVADAAVLDGGWQAWLDEGGETATEATDVEQAEFTPDFQPQRLAEIGDLKESHKADEVTVVDTRSDAEFTGQGHIPEAVHLEWTELLDENGRFKSPDELRELFAGSGIEPESTAVTYCRSGGRASVEALALELAGFKNVKNYYCSWQEWSADPDAPVEKPEEEKPEEKPADE